MLNDKQFVVSIYWMIILKHSTICGWSMYWMIPSTL